LLIKSFTQRVVNIIQNIPKGKVATYGQVADLAGNRYAARQVVWILSSQSGLHKLPWHRVINSQGKIGLLDEGYKEQKKLLLKEGIVFDEKDKISFREFLWKPKLKRRQL
jgi:methylated-DNA-protein-cysteine methyltransferase-like protein